MTGEVRHDLEHGKLHCGTKMCTWLDDACGIFHITTPEMQLVLDGRQLQILLYLDELSEAAVCMRNARRFDLHAAQALVFRNGLAFTKICWYPLSRDLHHPLVGRFIQEEEERRSAMDSAVA
jgi:hypothetical protein